MTPQHLQHQDAHHHAMLAARLHGVAPRCHGLLHLNIDILALQEGKISLPSGAAIMPKGECLQWHENEGTVPQPRFLPSPEEVPEQRCDVFLVLSACRPGAANVAHEPRKAAGRRYLAEPAALTELTDGATPAIDIVLAKPHVRLAFAHELQDDDCRLHLFTALRLPHGGAQLDTTFLPRSLRLQALGELVARLQALHSSVRTTEARLRPKAGHASALLGPDAAVRHRALVQLHTSLSDLLGDPLTAPIDVYRELRACLAWLSAPLPQGTQLSHTLTRFDDDRPAEALWPLVAAVEQAVRLEPLPIHVYPARQMAKSGLFIANLAPWPKQQANEWFVQVQMHRADGAPLDTDSLQRLSDAWLRLGKVAAPSQMPRLIRSALRGLALRPADTKSLGADMPQSAGTLLFALDTADATWPLVEAEGDIVLLPPPTLALQSSHTLEVAIICGSATVPQP